jgi:hypothetical protein
MLGNIGPVIPGASLSVEVYGATPGDTIYLAVGARGITCPALLGGTCIDVSPSTVFPLGTADGSGQLSAAPTVPASIPLGARRKLQLIGGAGAVGYTSIPWDRVVTGACPSGGSDCNLLGNPGVRSYIDPFRAVTSALDLSWSSNDHTGSATSGSVKAELLAAGSRTTAWQCIAVQPGETISYDGFGYLLDRGEPTDILFAEYIFYQDADCTGRFAGFDETAPSSDTGIWTYLSFPSIPVPSGAVSVRVGHGIGSTVAGTVAYIDDVQLLKL